MSGHNALFELNETATTAHGGKILDFGNAVPTNGTPGFAPSCIFLDTNSTGGASSATHIFINVGTAASCNFDGITVS
tara:strand:+ start:797 stop:1027 length:231 start_codon:yes stop_codon:yes gene_type:complete